MNALIEAARRLQSVLMRETAAARRASLSELTEIFDEKEEALAALIAAEPPPGEIPADTVRSALRDMLAAAEENALVLGAVAGAMEAVQDRLRQDLAATTNPGTYAPQAGPRGGLRRSLAATINRTV
jgi:hypothetical protein